MNLGVGIDIVEISRFEKYSDHNDSFLRRIFTEDEIKYCFSRKPSSQHFAGKYAAKEAIVKALHQTEKDVGKYRNMEVLNNEEGSPYVSFLGELDKKPKIVISISHDKDKAIAIAIALE